jgi:drug/metabolite transporter (DMT)-like permease
MRQRTIGILEVAASGICFGFMGPLAKWAYSLGLATGQLLSLLFLVAAALLGSALALTGKPVRIGLVPAARAVSFGVLGYATFSSCYFGALRGLSVSLAVLLLYTYPIWVTVGEAFLLRERPGRRQLFALAILLAGLALLLSGELAAREPVAFALGLLSSVFYAGYILASRRWLGGIAPAVSSLYVMLGAGVTLGALQLRALPATGAAWIAVLGLAVLGTILPIGLFLSGLQKLRAAEASMLSLVEPCTGVAAGAVFLGERLGPLQAAGAVVIGAGLLLIAGAGPAGRVVAPEQA